MAGALCMEMLCRSMRSIWALVVVCLVAATGVQPLHAADLDGPATHAQLGDQHPALPAVTAARHDAPLVGAHARTRLLAVLVALPVLKRPLTCAVADAAPRCEPRVSALLLPHSARGPPVR
jgi:hypothetical protein